ncbi:hypothetical protein [Prevotella sp. 10(H)]|uniref:gliding motility lipoprotein GldD n=1 Tax=Prevotella sp. 10(H) TaxID=1158294 RepID=UPI0004A6BFC4|nr:hypothetical protein [Prevotella sp. 10(H)]
MKKLYIILFTFLFVFVSCNEHTPQPKGYSRIDRSKTELMKFDYKYFSFLYSADSKVEEVKKEASEGYWFNINYPAYNAIIYCTYLSIDSKVLNKALEDSYQLAYSQSLKANAIQQSLFEDSLHNKTSIIYDIKGMVASPVQFYVTDNQSHFLRGSMYFDQTFVPDSVAPIVEFLRDDIRGIIESLEWKKK